MSKNSFVTLTMPLAVLVSVGTGCGAADDSNRIEATVSETRQALANPPSALVREHQEEVAGIKPQNPDTEMHAICHSGYTCIANCWGGDANWFEVYHWGIGSCTADANYDCWLKGKTDGKAWGVCFGSLY